MQSASTFICPEHYQEQARDLCLCFKIDGIFSFFKKKKLDISIIYYLSTLVFDYFSILVINCCICVS